MKQFQMTINHAEIKRNAIDCYNKTTDHIFTVKKVTTIEEIENYT